MFPEGQAAMVPGVREGIKCDQIQLQGMSVCWHRWINATDGADPAPWTASSQHHWSDLRSFMQWFILTAGFIFYCPAPSVLFFLASISHFILLLPVEVSPLPSSLPPLFFPLHTGRTTSSCSHFEGLSLCWKQQGPDRSLLQSCPGAQQTALCEWCSPHGFVETPEMRFN